ncbi:hypothetical protein [Nocardioides daphniae]|nr:hypothetical protein [Nocardioides daphniae]QCC76153.1 hypothetical protein E2C04_01150 [Nocardioides daphniae]
MAKMKVKDVKKSVALGRAVTDSKGAFRISVTEKVASSLKKGRFDATFVVVDAEGALTGYITTMETTRTGVRILPELVDTRAAVTAKVPSSPLRPTVGVDTTSTPPEASGRAVAIAPRSRGRSPRPSRVVSRSWL